jgi:molybdopterin-guanine dinucleotide biosynthesis protein A
MRIGGILLCGGKSLRMGQPKALLPFGDELMVQRVARILGEVVAPIVVVAAEGQELPSLPLGTIIVHDEHPDCGPLEGLRSGLKAIAAHADAAYVTSVDVPLLLPAFVRSMIDELGDADIAVPVEEENGKLFHHPLAGVYRTSVLPVAEKLLAEDRRRMVYLFDGVPTKRVPAVTLKSVDSELRSLRNLNVPEDYQVALDIQFREASQGE